MKKMCNQRKCKLCGGIFLENEMSEEHYPARNTGNDDVVAVDLKKYFDYLTDQSKLQEVRNKLNKGESIEKIAGDIFDNEMATSIFPNGRTARTLCRDCNTFLGKYDEAYLKFYKKDGAPEAIKGFQKQTKLNIIKAIFAKFLSIPEANDENFDFIDFIRNEQAENYDGEWKLYFVKRSIKTDILGLPDLQTGKLNFDQGIVYEFSDHKFIFDLINFKKPDRFEMTNIFDILERNYKLISDLGSIGGFHSQIIMQNVFKW